MVKTKILKSVLKELEEKHGLVTPKMVVNIARPIDSPIHELFEWNDTKAAEEYRLWQARGAIARVKIEWMGKETDAYWNATINVESVNVQGYYSTEKVLSNDKLYKVVLNNAIQELLYWQKKYKELQELKSLINEVELTKVTQSLG